MTERHTDADPIEVLRGANPVDPESLPPGSAARLRARVLEDRMAGNERHGRENGDRPYAINIQKSNDEQDVLVACGNVGGKMWDGELIVGLQQVSDSGLAGIALLREANEQTIISLYVMTVGGESDVASGLEAAVEISGDEGGWAFSPARLEIAAGTTVVWTNTTDTSHTITGSDLAFEDSGPFGNGESWRQTFTEPGTYRYFCSPHPFMPGISRRHIGM